MPGIVGLVTKMPREQAEAELCRMLGSMRHESCDRTGTWSDESAGVYVGWTSRQHVAETVPICNEKGDVVLVFSGEEFPDPETICQLKRRGHRFREGGQRPISSTSFEEDERFPAGLNGRFHGIVTDRTRGMTTLFNDRYGMHRLYYHESKDAFYFAAEAKAILAVRPELRRADPRGLGEFVACGCVLENRTLFDGVRVMPSSSAWVFRHGALEKKTSYFDPREWEQQTILEPEPYYQELRAGVLAKASPIFRRTGAGRDVPDRRSGQPHDHGVAQAGAGIAGLLQLSGDVPRLPGHHPGAAGRASVRSASSGDLGRVGVSVPLPCLRGAHGLAVGRLRRSESVPDLYVERTGTRDRPGADDGQLWRRSPPPGSGVQADRAKPGTVSSGVSVACAPGDADLQRVCCTDIRCLLRYSSRRPGSTTVCSRSSRRRCPCGRRISTTTSSAPCSARRRSRMRATTCACD